MDTQRNNKLRPIPKKKRIRFIFFGLSSTATTWKVKKRDQPFHQPKKKNHQNKKEETKNMANKLSEMNTEQFLYITMKLNMSYLILCVIILIYAVIKNMPFLTIISTIYTIAGIIISLKLDKLEKERKQKEKQTKWKKEQKTK